MKLFGMKHGLAGAAVTAALVSTAAFAGSSSPGFFSCTRYSDGSGYCSGTYNGWRLSCACQ